MSSPSWEGEGILLRRIRATKLAPTHRDIFSVKRRDEDFGQGAFEVHNALCLSSRSFIRRAHEYAKLEVKIDIHGKSAQPHDLRCTDTSRRIRNVAIAFTASLCEGTHGPDVDRQSFHSLVCARFVEVVLPRGQRQAVLIKLENGKNQSARFPQCSDCNSGVHGRRIFRSLENRRRSS